MTRIRPQRRIRAVGAALLLSTACASTGLGDDAIAAQDAPAGAEPLRALTDAGPSDATGPVVRATRIATLPHMATTLTASPDGTELLVGDRRGVVRRLTRGDVDGFTVPVLDEEIVLDVSDRVSLQFDRGFIGMALVDAGRSLVVMFTDGDGASTLEQYDYEPGTAIDTASKRTLFELPWPYPWHHGGGLALDRDGNLLVGIGDKGVSLPGVPGPQDPELLLGGVLRIPEDVLADRSASWSPDPRDFIARGFRNPWRISVDHDNGDVWIGDVGDLVSEELNRIPGADVGRSVLNFGYPYYEGSNARHERIPPDVDFAPATVERTRSEGACGMVAGYPYRGGSIDRLQDRMIYGDLCSLDIYAIDVGRDGSASAEAVIGTLPESIVSFGEGADGALYALGYLGGVFRLDPSDWDVDDSSQKAPSDAGPTTTAPVADIDCGVGSAIEPLGFINGLSPTALEVELTRANATLAVKVPKLPPEVMDAGRRIQEVIAELVDIYRAAGWDPESPALSTLRTDMLAGSGVFEGFPDAVASFFGSRCT